MNKKNWLIIGVAILVAFGIYSYQFDFSPKKVTILEDKTSCLPPTGAPCAETCTDSVMCDLCVQAKLDSCVEDGTAARLACYEQNECNWDEACVQSCQDNNPYASCNSVESASDCLML